MESLFSAGNLSIILSTLTTIVAVGVSYGILSQKVKSLEKEQGRLDNLISPFGERIARVEERTNETLEIAKEIRAVLFKR